MAMEERDAPLYRRGIGFLKVVLAYLGFRLMTRNFHETYKAFPKLAMGDMQKFVGIQPWFLARAVPES